MGLLLVYGAHLGAVVYEVLSFSEHKLQAAPKGLSAKSAPHPLDTVSLFQASIKTKKNPSN